jgi:long-chain acyl-CoA synthetase
MKCGFFAGDVQKLTDDLALLKPTIFPSVPRLYNRFHDKIKAKFDAATGVGGWLARTALASKLSYLKSGSGLTHSIYDRLVFKAPREILGGRVRCMITGSAPIAGNVLDFLKVCFSCDICEGYGMTETCAGSVLTKEGDPQTGIVGGPLQNVKLRLKDIPEMNYLHTNAIPTGEVYFYGASIMRGYYKNEEKTNECIYDGWLASGDVGAVLPNGALKIIDRAKNIFKLSQGEYIAPEKLENVFVQSTYAMQVWLYGESLRDYTIMFMVADPGAIKAWCKSKGLNEDEWASQVDNEELR